MFRRWHHGHSTGLGVLVGLGMASYRVWLLLAVAFLLGVLATLLVVNARALVHWLRDLMAAWSAHRAERQSTRLAQLRDAYGSARARRRGFPRGY